MVNFQEEFSDYIEAGFNPVLTEDGSLSLQPAEAFGAEQEQMHSRGGALSESIFVYMEALDHFFTQKVKPVGSVVESVGLGLGYNEILVAVSSFKYSATNIRIFSYESEKVLESLFFRRLEHPQNYPLYWSQFDNRFDYNQAKLTSFLKKKIELKGVLQKSTIEKNEKEQRLILFDAYSNKTSESLWTEDFLKTYLSTCKEGSVLATYAATGVLKRALEDCGFKNLNKSGFLKKRQSTLAVKT
jgi:tRNA U34 5-methylaminomethyl-2-thiouridine-forming methyltransferase MnmC